MSGRQWHGRRRGAKRWCYSVTFWTMTRSRALTLADPGDFGGRDRQCAPPPGASLEDTVPPHRPPRSSSRCMGGAQPFVTATIDAIAIARVWLIGSACRCSRDDRMTSGPRHITCNLCVIQIERDCLIDSVWLNTHPKTRFITYLFHVQQLTTIYKTRAQYCSKTG